jgi:hypothetical protein
MAEMRLGYPAAARVKSSISHSCCHILESLAFETLLKALLIKPLP